MKFLELLESTTSYHCEYDDGESGIVEALSFDDLIGSLNEDYEAPVRINAVDGLESWVFEDSEDLDEAAKPIWRRRGQKVVRGYRCTSGRKQGRIVSSAATCGGKLDVKKRLKMKKLMQQKGKRLRLKAKRTKKKNPVSKRLQALNKAAGK